MYKIHLISYHLNTSIDSHTLKTAVLFFSLLAFIIITATTKFIQQSTEYRPVATGMTRNDLELVTAPASINKINLREAYNLYSGYSASSGYFGAYALKAVSDRLYIAVSDGFPPEGNNGAMLAYFQGQSLNPLEVTNQSNPHITEQGLHSLFVTSDQSTLIVPGTDPCCSDNWDYGNVYLHRTDSNNLYKFRELSGLDHVVHFWRIAETPKGFFGAVSSFFQGLGDWGTAGEIFSSSNGSSWQRVTHNPADYISNPSKLLSTYRITDIIWFANKLYIHNLREGSSNQNVIQFSDNYGGNWQQLPSITAATNPQMHVFGNLLIGATFNGQNMFVVDEQNNVIKQPILYMGQAQYIAETYQPFASSDEYFFVITKNGKVLKTTDPFNGVWELVDSFSEPLLAIEYWATNNSLIVSTQGENGKLYQLDPNQVIIPTSSPSPIPAVCLPCSDDRYDHNKDGIIDQSDLKWFMNNCLGQLPTSICPDLDQNGGLFNSGTLMCVVRCQNTVLSSPTPSPSLNFTPTPTAHSTVTIVPATTVRPYRIKPRVTLKPIPTTLPVSNIEVH